MPNLPDLVITKFDVVGSWLEVRRSTLNLVGFDNFSGRAFSKLHIEQHGFVFAVFTFNNCRYCAVVKHFQNFQLRYNDGRAGERTKKNSPI